MNQKLLEKSLELKAEIDSLPEVIELKRLDKLLGESDEVKLLSYKKDVCKAKYDDLCRYLGESSLEAKEAQKSLYEAKLALDNNELVKQYKMQYKIVKSIYTKINNEIFDPFR